MTAVKNAIVVDDIASNKVATKDGIGLQLIIKYLINQIVVFYGPNQIGKKADQKKRCNRKGQQEEAGFAAEH